MALAGEVPTTTPMEDVAPEQIGNHSGDEFHTIQLEACETETPSTETKTKDEETEEAPTPYPHTKQKTNTADTTSQSPGISEITPVEVDTDQQASAVDCTNAPVRICVSDPKRAEEVSKLGIRSAFISYRIQTETSLLDFPFTKRCVWRRFKDFDTLHRLLRENHRGFIIPILPSKNFFESKRATDMFLQERQMELNKFLNQVALHKDLYCTEEFRVFLGHPEDLSSSHVWRQLIENGKLISAESADAAEMTDLDKPGEILKRDVTTLFKKVGNTIRREMLSHSYSISEAEKTLQDMVPHLKRLELSLGMAVEKSHGYVAQFEGIGSGLESLGSHWITMSCFEEEHAAAIGHYTAIGQVLVTASSVLHKAGYAAARIQQIYQKSTELLKARVMSLADHLNITPAVLHSLHDRTLVLRHLYDAQNQLEVSRRSLDNLTKESNKKLGGATGFNIRASGLRQEIQNSVDAVSKRTELYDMITKRNFSELDRLNGARKEDLHRMALSISKMHQECFETVALIWVNLADEVSQLMPEEQENE